MSKAAMLGCRHKQVTGKWKRFKTSPKPHGTVYDKGLGKLTVQDSENLVYLLKCTRWLFSS